MKNWLIPPGIYNIIRSKVGTRKTQTYTDFIDAVKASHGYEDPNLVNIIDIKTQKYLESLQTGNFGIIPNYRVLTLLKMVDIIINSNANRVKILDIGGQLGILYYELNSLVSLDKSIDWLVYETENLVKVGNQKYINEELRFTSNIEDYQSEKFDIIVALNSLQYTDSPYQLLNKIYTMEPNYIIFGRFPIINTLEEDKIIIQKSKLSDNGPGTIKLESEKIIEYPVNLLSRKKILKEIEKYGKYSLILDIKENSIMYRFENHEIKGVFQLYAMN